MIKTQEAVKSFARCILIIAAGFISSSAFAAEEGGQGGKGGGSDGACKPQPAFGANAEDTGGGGSTQSHSPGGGTQSGGGTQTPMDAYLMSRIKACGLDKYNPPEFEGCNGSEAWFEFMRGLAFIESSWDAKCFSKDSGLNSRGLFQSSEGDKLQLSGTSCYEGGKKPEDAKANIDCAVRMMLEVHKIKASCTDPIGSESQDSPGGSGGSTQASSGGGGGESLFRDNKDVNWGPLMPSNPAHGKVKSVIQRMKDLQHCGDMSKAGAYAGAETIPIDWSKENLEGGADRSPASTSTKTGKAQ